MVAMETLSDDDLGYILDLSPNVRKEMKMKSDYRKQMIIYWLETSPYAAWSYLGGQCLYEHKKQALDIIKCFIKTNRGEL